MNRNCLDRSVANIQSLGNKMLTIDWGKGEELLIKHLSKTDKGYRSSRRTQENTFSKVLYKGKFMMTL